MNQTAHNLKSDLIKVLDYTVVRGGLGLSEEKIVMAAARRLNKYILVEELQDYSVPKIEKHLIV
jgi:hypothetical protein